MVAGRFKGRGQSFEQSGAMVMNRRGLSVHEPFRSHDFSSKNLSDALMTKTNAEKWSGFSEFADHITADACFRGGAGTGGNTDSLGRFFADFVERDLIVPVNLHLCAQFTEVLDEIVGKGIVVVDHKEHRPECRIRLRFGQLTLFKSLVMFIRVVAVTWLDLKAIKFYSLKQDSYLSTLS
jgi:hypothetical protein